LAGWRGGGEGRGKEVERKRKNEERKVKDGKRWGLRDEEREE